MAWKTDWVSFNPTLVRLRRGLRGVPGELLLLFQSHAGSIEARDLLQPPPGHLQFQSHAGSIEARGPCQRPSAC